MDAMRVAQSGLEAQQIQLRAIANNLANINTVGYKKERGEFADLVYQDIRRPGADNEANTILANGIQIGMGVKVIGIQKLYSDGAPQITDQATDLMISGDPRAFFRLERTDGSLVYTRNGEFQVGPDRKIIHAATGYPIEGVDELPENYTDVQIGRDGVVSVRAQGEEDFNEIGNIQLHRFVNPAGLEALGNNLMQESTASGEPFTYDPASESGAGSITAGSLESSNVNMVEEMVNMIDAQRAYDINSKVISTDSEMKQTAIRNL